jgi:hypothetical protein
MAAAVTDFNHRFTQMFTDFAMDLREKGSPSSASRPPRRDMDQADEDSTRMKRKYTELNGSKIQLKVNVPAMIRNSGRDRMCEHIEPAPFTRAHQRPDEGRHNDENGHQPRARHQRDTLAGHDHLR